MVLTQQWRKLRKSQMTATVVSNLRETTEKCDSKCKDAGGAVSDAGLRADFLEDN